ncbi:FtsX-like permease family protein [Longispora albida]|uniref:FtsX-like permease family protein n=1 Tax=Longispora albida TaxID=203523 RepID=UPI00036D065F|nr:FtsX-like permease family protein [Longispora albida]
MWFLAWREIKHSRVRFGLLATLVALVAYLVFVMTGLAVGLGEASVSGLRKLPGDHVLFAGHVQRSLDRSDLPAGLPVGGTPIGFSMANLASGQEVVSVGLLGIGDQPGLILDTSAKEKLRAGQTVKVQPSGMELTVAGFADLGTYQHTPVAQVPLSTWQELRRTPGRVSAYLLDGSVTAPPGTELATKDEAIGSVGSYVAETSTIGLIRSFLYGGAALLIATVFWILTLQKEGSLAVLRATGARRTLLLGSYLLEVLLTLAAGVGVSAGLAAMSSVLLPDGVFALRLSDTLAAAGLLTLLALAGSLVSMRRLLTVDPLLSLGRSS